MPDFSFAQLLLSLLALPYVLGPLLVFFNVKSMALPAVHAIAATEVPPEHQPFFHRTVAALAPEGLGAATYLRCTGIVRGSDSYGSGARVSVATPTSLPSLIASSIHRDFARQAERGYYGFEPSSREYRPTLRGATLMTWRQLFSVEVDQPRPPCPRAR